MNLTAVDMCKRFGVTVALDNAHVELCSGQIHSLVGENGAGKSTLLKAIAAVHKADSGEIFIDDKPFAAKNLLDASKQGVTIVFQESTINPYVSIEENIFIDRLHEYNSPLTGIKWKNLRGDAQRILDSMQTDIKVEQDINSLDLGQWKLIEVAKALSYEPSVLLLDESTAFLNNKEARAFLNVIKKLREQGLAIGFVSHHLNEVFDISDRITVMRDGKFVAEFPGAEVNAEILESAMVGRAIGPKMYPDRNKKIPDEIVLQVENLSVKDQLDDISFDLRKGEILGIGGLKGAGGEAILDAVYGVQPISAGSIRYSVTAAAEKYSVTSPSQSLRRRIALAPGERTLEGLIPDFSIRENLTMANPPRKGFLRDKMGERKTSEYYVEHIKIKTNNIDNPTNSLSGGNMQKVVLGKCLAVNPHVMLLNNPTRGIDISARQEIYALMRELARGGLSIIMLTEDLLELLGMSDRIMLMRKKKISKLFSENSNLREEDLIGHIV